MIEKLIDRLIQWDVAPVAAEALARLVALGAVFLTAWAAFVLARGLVVRVLYRLFRMSRIRWDDVLVEHRVLERLAHLVPALVIYHAGPLVFDQLSGVVRIVATIYLIGVGLRVADAALDVFHDLLEAWDTGERIPVKGFVQALKIVAYIAAGILILGAILDKPPWFFLSGLGAMTAVVLLIFREPILGFVAGIQLTANDMVKVGDWIEMPKYGADGDVIDVSLTTVKVQNWDKTITSLPAYALISDSFRNWRGMKDSGGRRIKRALHLDMTSVRFCDPDLIGRLGRIQILKEYIERKQEELAEHNRRHGIDDATLVNGRRMTNLGVFRAYVTAYLRTHPRVRQDMTFLVRQLSPTEHGLPLEIYVFSNDQVWANYEGIQADIFDHLLAAVPEFDLRVFQSPSGVDLRAAAQQLGKPGCGGSIAAARGVARTISSAPDPSGGEPGQACRFPLLLLKWTRQRCEEAIMERASTDRLADLLAGARGILVFTGAGVSTGSGIPDFRGPDGVWKTRQPVLYDDFLNSESARVEYWEWKRECRARSRDAVPNAAHRACARLEEAGRLEAVVTQNVDGLHEKAGVSRDRLVELHGTDARVTCLTCEREAPLDESFASFETTGRAPRCACGGFLKPATISFGQALRPDDLERAARAAQACDLAVSLGSTLSVHPAAGFPLLAAGRGVPYVVINRGVTDHDGLPEVTLRLEGDVVEIFPPAVERAIAAAG